MEEIFARTLEVVSGTTDVSPELILSKDRHEEVVDARYLLVYLLHKQGMYPYFPPRGMGFRDESDPYDDMDGMGERRRRDSRGRYM